MLSKLTAYPGGQAQKEALVASMRAHVEADTMVRDHGYWSNGKGCAVGCALNSLGVDVNDRDDHARYESLIGVHKQIAQLQDAIFEGLPNGEAQTFAVDLLRAIPVGADLAPAYHRFMAWMLDDPTEGVIRFADGGGKSAISAVADLHRQSARGGDAADAAWDDARDAAWAAGGAAWAAWDDARDAAWVARDAARDAAWAAGGAAWAARDAARAARDAAWVARDAARDAAWAAGGTAWAARAAARVAGAARAAAYQSFAARLILEIKAA